MKPDAFIQALHDWQGFYTLLGGAAATLTGLMFVAASVGTSVINDTSGPKVRTFITPTVIYFSFVLLLTALMNVPTQTAESLAAELLVAGLTAAGYTVSHLPRLLRFHRDALIDARNWAWNLILPLIASLWLAGAACGLQRSVTAALNAAAFGTVMLVMIGIRNAWDVTLFLTRRTPS